MEAFREGWRGKVTGREGGTQYVGYRVRPRTPGIAPDRTAPGDAAIPISRGYPPKKVTFVIPPQAKYPCHAIIGG
jgi:hypothetical protein